MNRFLGSQQIVPSPTSTGASPGLGRAIACEFGRHGARLALIARNAARLQQAMDEISELGGEATVFPADVLDPSHEVAEEK
jgi:NADP-dependent 3-hydroxy acid dehydrogenase YdfG